jgi:hypothetical protein
MVVRYESGQAPGRKRLVRRAADFGDSVLEVIGTAVQATSESSSQEVEVLQKV